MPAPTLTTEQINALKEALKSLDDADMKIAAAEKAGLDVAAQKATSKEQRDKITRLLGVYAPTALPKTAR